MGTKRSQSSDIGQVKAQSGGSPVTVANFLLDLTVDGSINSTDVSAVKVVAGTVVP